VDWEKLTIALDGNSVSSLWLDLQPVSLLHWLKSIEKRGGFQYSQDRRDSLDAAERRTIKEAL
jgi:hypothetical protein